MKNTKINTGLKLGLVTLSMLAINVVSAQKITGDVAKETNAIPGSLNKSIRVIDNKGTIKYLQSKNGITMLTNTTADVTTTTWQLGGTLSDDTTIDVAGKVFDLKGLAQETGASATVLVAGTPAVVDVNGVIITPAIPATISAVGYTLLVRDENTGATKKMLATDLLQSGQEVFTAAAAQAAYALTGAPTLPTYSKVWVFRNGAKLVANTDYTVSGSTVTLVPNTIAPNDWVVYAGDVIEVQYIK